MPTRSTPRTIRRLRAAATALLALGALAVAALLLRKAFLETSPAEVVRELRHVTPLRFLASLLATAGSYAALIGTERLSLRTLRRRDALPGSRRNAFIAFAMANNLPMSLVIGATVRRRLYGRAVLRGREIAALVVANTTTYVLGLVATTGVAFLLAPLPLADSTVVHPTRWLGALLLAAVLSYLVWCAATRRPIRLGALRVPITRPRVAVHRLALSTADWLCSAAGLWLLLPPDVAAPTMLSAFMLGQLVTLVAQVPGGIGVFEATLLWRLDTPLNHAATLGALALYRLTYFIIPLLIATLWWGMIEWRRWRLTRRRARPRDA